MVSAMKEELILEEHGKTVPLCCSYRLLVWMVLGLGSTLSFISLSSQAAVFTCRRLRHVDHEASGVHGTSELPSIQNFSSETSWIQNTTGPSWIQNTTERSRIHNTTESSWETTTATSTFVLRDELKHFVHRNSDYILGNGSNFTDGRVSCVAPLWSKTSEGWVLAAISIGYYVIQMPAAVIAMHVGSRHVVLAATCLCVLTSFLSVPAMTWGPIASAVVCFVRGASAGALYPALTSLASAWSGVGETSLMTSFVESGLQVGHAASFLAAAAFCNSSNGWANVFYSNGALGFIFAAAFWVIALETPAEKTKLLRMSNKEQDFLKEAMATKGFTNEKQKIPYKSILTSLPVMAVVIAQFGSEWLDCLMVTSLPQFLGVRHAMSEKMAELLTSLGFLLSIPVAMVAGWVADWMIEKSRFSTTCVRKTFDLLSKGVPVICYLTLAYLDQGHVVMVSVIYVISSCSIGLTDSAWPANCFDLAPTLAGFLIGLGEGMTAWVWAVTVVVVAYLAPQDTAEQWQTVMYVTTGLICACALFYLAFASGHQQPWATCESTNSNDYTAVSGDEYDDENDNEKDEDESNVDNPPVVPY